MFDGNGRRRGFSLVELLVVILIIVIVIALVIPALGGARNVAKLATTRSTIKEFAGAVDAFRQDNVGRAPGVFGPAEMGSRENADQFGFSAMENAILELAGGLVYASSMPGNAANFGPTAAAHQENRDVGRWVRVDLIGADYDGNPGYYQPIARFFRAVERGTSQVPFDAADADIPDLLDAWGNPLLLWIRDETAPPVDELEDFARQFSDNGPARYYWASNAAFLQATRLGDGGNDQTTSSGGAHSLLGGGVDRQHLRITMAGALGNPAYPAGDLDDAGSYQAVLPSAGRAGVIVHSAGSDGVYLSTRDRTAKGTGAADTGMYYGLTFFDANNQRLKSDGGGSATRDLLEGFDDVVFSAGN